MFVPIHDDNPLKKISFQYVTLALIALNVAIFAFEAGVDQAVIASFAVVPAELFQVNVLGGAAPESTNALRVPEAYTLVTYMFFHGDVFHLLGNMLFLWVFGDNVEDALGHVKFLAFYLACGIFAGLLQAGISYGLFGNAPAEIALVGAEETVQAGYVPLIGASGAVAGVIAAYLMLHPRVRVWVLALKYIPLRISALLALGVWIAYQVVMVIMPSGEPIAWWAHIGGFIAGAVLVVFMRRPGVPLFDRDVTTAA